MPIRYLSGVNVDSNTLVVDAANDRVGIGTASPVNSLTIQKSTSTGTVAAIPGVVFSNRNTTNSIFVHSGIFADTYRDVSDPHYSGGIWFTRNPEISNLSSSSDIVFGTQTSVVAGVLPSERMRIKSTGNVGIGTTAPNAKLNVNTDAMGVTVSDASGISLTNATAAASGAQQMSPTLRWSGQGWKTTATAASQNVSFISFLTPVQGTSAPSGILNFASSINGAAYTTRMSLTSAGALSISAGFSATTGVFSSTVTNTIANLTTTPTDGVVIVTPTAATSVIPVRISPRLRISGTAWNTGGTPASNTMNWTIDNLPTSGNPPTSALRFNFDRNNGGYSPLVSFISNGNVGIGTTAPGYRLHVKDSANVGTIAIGHDLYPVLLYSDAGSGEFRIDNRASSSSGYITFYPNGQAGTIGSEAMRITTAGNVGIGTTAPASIIHVSTTGANAYSSTITKGSNMKGIVNTLSNNGDDMVGIYFATGTDAAGAHWSGITGSRSLSSTNWGTQLNFYTHDENLSNINDSTQKMVIKGSGNVGIGTTSPAAALHVQSSATKLVLSNTDFNTSTTTGSGLILHTGASSGNTYGQIYAFQSGNTAYANLVVPGGNVGINTTNPTERLDVAGNGKLQGNLYLTAANPYIEGSGSGAMRIRHTAGQTMYIRPDQTGEVVFFEGASGQTVYLNTASPAVNSTQNSSSTLTFEARARNAGGTLNIKSTSLQNTVYDIASNLSRFSIAGQNVLYLDGNVGVGTNTPLSRLHTKGEIRIEDATDTTTRDYILKTETTGALSFTDSVSGERMRIDYTGKVGINTTGPGGLLGLGVQTSVQGTNGITLGVNDNNIEFVHAVFGNGFGSKFYSVDSGSGVTSLRIAGRGNSTSWSDLVTILVTDSASTRGNVGIGTTGPTEKLHVDGSTLITYNNSFQSTNSVGNKAILARVSPTAGIVNYAEYATATNLNGFVIGSDDARVKGNITGDSLEFITNTSTRMTILSGGNVGINNTNPSYRLDVTGDARINTGSLGVNVVPNATDGRIDASNDIVAFSTSDRRLKENITPIANALEKVRSLTGVEFDWKEETKKAHGHSGRDTGVIAQEVQAIMPTAVRTNNTGYLAVRYEKLIGLLIEGMKEQQAQIDKLKAQINDSSR